MSLEAAGTWFWNVRKVNNTILHTVGELACYNVVMLFPDRSEYHLTYWPFFLLSNLAQIYCAQKPGLMPSEWTLAILFNVHRFPMDQEGNEQILVEFNFAHGTEIRHQSTVGCS